MGIITNSDLAHGYELVPSAISDPAEIAVVKEIRARSGAWWMPRPTMMEGVSPSTRTFAWKDVVNGQKLSPSISGVNPILLSESGQRNFLRLGHDGALTYTSSGALQTADGTEVWSGGSVIMFAIYRVPPENTTAGAAPGGAVVGNMQSQADGFSASVNKVWTGLRAGYGSGSTKEASFSVNGDAIYTNPPGTRDDEDGKWKVGIGVFDAVAQTMEQRLNGVQLVKVTTQTGDPLVNAVLSTLAGNRRLRVGATGAPNASVLTNTFRGDIAHVGVIGTADAGVVALLESCLLTKYPLI